jgi:hypothetical protein
VSSPKCVCVLSDVLDADELSAFSDVPSADPSAECAFVYSGEGRCGFKVDPHVGVAAGDGEEAGDVPLAAAGSAVDGLRSSGDLEHLAAVAVVADGGAGDAPAGLVGVGVPSGDGAAAELDLAGILGDVEAGLGEDPILMRLEEAHDPGQRDGGVPCPGGAVEGSGGGEACLGGDAVGDEAAVFADDAFPVFEDGQHGDFGGWVVRDESDEGELRVEGLDDEGRA